MSEPLTSAEMRWFVARGAEQDVAGASAMPGAASAHPIAPDDRAATLTRIVAELDQPGSAADRYLDALRTLAEHAWDVQWAALPLTEGESSSGGEPSDLADVNAGRQLAAADRARTVRAWLAAEPDDPHALAGLLLALRDSLADLASEGGSIEQRTNRAIVEQLRQRLFGGEVLSLAASRGFYGAAARTLAALIAQRAEQRLRQHSAPAGDTAVAGQEATLELAGLAPLRTLERDRALERLTTIEPRLSEIYRLAAFAGRNSREIAALLDADPADVEADLETATVEVCLGEL